MTTSNTGTNTITVERSAKSEIQTHGSETHVSETHAKAHAKAHESLFVSDKYESLVRSLANAMVTVEKRKGSLAKEIRELAIQSVQASKDALEEAKDDGDPDLIAQAEQEYIQAGSVVAASIAVHLGNWQTEVHGQIDGKVRSNVVNYISKICRETVGYTLKTVNRGKGGNAPEGGYKVAYSVVHPKADRKPTASAKGVGGAVAAPTSGSKLDVNLTNPINAARQSEEVVRELSLPHVLSLLLKEHGDQAVKDALNILTQSKPKLVASTKDAVNTLYNKRTVS